MVAEAAGIGSGPLKSTEPNEVNRSAGEIAEGCPQGKRSAVDPDGRVGRAGRREGRRFGKIIGVQMISEMGREPDREGRDAEGTEMGFLNLFSRGSEVTAGRRRW